MNYCLRSTLIVKALKLKGSGGQDYDSEDNDESSEEESDEDEKSVGADELWIKNLKSISCADTEATVNDIVDKFLESQQIKKLG